MRWRSPWISRWSRHSRRSVPTYRSAKEFARGDRTGILMIRVPLPVNTASNIAVNLLSRERIRNSNRAARSPRSMNRLRACRTVHAPGGVRGDAQAVHPPGLDLHHEQDVQALQEHGINVQEVAGEDLGRLGGQELPPVR